MQKIVVLEDDHAIANMYEIKLSASGFDVSVAYNGEDGLDLVHKTKPHLLLLDLKMPYMNGDAVLEELRTHDWAKDLRVIILTNLTKDEAPMKLRFLGVDRYIVKAHHTPAQVLAVAQEVLGLNNRFADSKQ